MYSTILRNPETVPYQSAISVFAKWNNDFKPYGVDALPEEWVGQSFAIIDRNSVIRAGNTHADRSRRPGRTLRSVH